MIESFKKFFKRFDESNLIAVEAIVSSEVFCLIRVDDLTYDRFQIEISTQKRLFTHLQNHSKTVE